MSGPVTALDPEGEKLCIFSSNDYLGLARHPRVLEAWREGAGFGTGSARLIAGDRPAHHALEEALEDRFGQPATLFSSGWHANLALLSTVLESTDRVASDALNHASLIDGIRLSRADKQILPHGSLDLLEGTRLLVLEGIYSMDGDIPDLERADRVTRKSGAWWMVDEAHALGVLGPGGAGAAAAAGVQPDFRVGTLGKALGSFGAFVLGPPELKQLLISQSRSFIFTTGIPEAAARAALAGLQLAEDGLRERLFDRVARLRQGLSELSIPALGQHHIVPIVLGSQTMEIARRLRRAGYLVPGIRPPTVAAGQERLRITLSAAHTDDQIDGLLEVLSKAPISAR
jgi:8-amino-7-oxononanoate synthase